MGSFLMLLAVLMKWAGILQRQLFQINQSEESSKITINTHITSCPLPMEYSSLLLAPDWMFHILMSLPSGFKLDFHLDLIENTTVQ